ncbi:hypothetical protein A2U01_0081062, partial [Trifolium medium]|nr:hypothetical protein [Trifolium medium]
GQATTLELVQPFENQIIHPGHFHRNSLEMGRKMRNNSLANRSHTLKCTPSTWMEDMAFLRRRLVRTE